MTIPPSPPIPDHFSFESAARASQSAQLQRRLRASGLRLETTSDTPLRVRVAHAGRNRITTLTTPSVSLRREFTSESLIVVARAGALRIATSGPVIVRGNTAALLPAGGAPALIQVTSPRAELLVVSAEADQLPDEITKVHTRVDRPELSPRRLAPLHLFLHVLAATPQQSRTSSGPLHDVADSMVRSIAAAIADDAVALDADSLHRRVTDYLCRNYSNVNLTVGSVAASFDVAPRTLQAAFTEEQATFSETLRQMRAAAARRIQAEHPFIPVASVATMCGFTSVSTMYRALRSTPVERD